MGKVLRATYHDGNLVLDEKLDTSLEGKKLTLVLVEDSDASARSELEAKDRKQQFFEKAATYSIKLPEDYQFNQEEMHDRNSFRGL